MQHDTDTLGPLDLAIIGALEKLAQEHSAAARLADEQGDKAHRKVERAAVTAFTNALIEFRRGVRPDVLPSGARVIPSRRPGEAPHLVTMDGDWVCSCAAHANMHWPIALVIGIEVALDMLADHDDPPGEPSPLGGDDAPNSQLSAPNSWVIGGVIRARQLESRLAATAQYLDSLRAALPVEAPPAKPLRVRLVEARRKSPYFASAFYLSKAA